MAEERFLQVENIDKIMAALGPEVVAGPVRDMLTAIALRLEEDARRNAPVDTGRLRASITHEVDQAHEVPEQAIVGTNVEYAPFQEYGTGIFADGDPAFKSSRVIMGGIMPRRFMRNALDDNAGYIQEQVDKCGEEIGKLWERADD